MSMTFEQVTPDTRVVLTAHGQKGTVMRKFMSDETPVILIDFDGVGPTMRTPDQLDPIAEEAPAPKLSRAYKGVSEFYIGGEEYQVFNSVSRAYPVNGFWQVWRKTRTAAGNEACIVTGARTKKAAFEQAVELLRPVEAPAPVADPDGVPHAPAAVCAATWRREPVNRLRPELGHTSQFGYPPCGEPGTLDRFVKAAHRDGHVPVYACPAHTRG